MRKITIPYIKTFNPCQSGLDNLIAHYPECNMKLSKFLSLENIPYDDKVWLVSKVTPVEILQQWSIDCAEFVADAYNEAYPDDNRISNCIEITKNYLLGKVSFEEIKLAANSASWAATSATKAARSTAWSTESATRSVVGSAARSASWATRSAELAAMSAAESARSAESAAKSLQEDINLSLLIALLDNVDA